MNINHDAGIIKSIVEIDTTSSPPLGGANSLTILGNGSLVIPTGTTIEQPSAGIGKIRYDSTTNSIMWSDNVKWKPLSSVSYTISHHFAWGDATPTQLAITITGKSVIKITLIIQTAFDTPSVITIGDVGDPSRLLSATDSDPMTVGTYQTNPGYVYGSDTAINLYIAPGGGNSVGNGIILMDIEV